MVMENNEQEQQELMYQLSMYEQQIHQLQQQLQAVDNGINELTNLNLGLDELVGKKDNEILAPIGRGIFVKSKLLSEKLIVDVGGKNFVKKNIPDTKKILDEQLNKLIDIQKQLSEKMEELSKEVTDLISKAQEKEEEEMKKNKSE